MSNAALSVRLPFPVAKFNLDGYLFRLGCTELISFRALGEVRAMLVNRDPRVAKLRAELLAERQLAPVLMQASSHVLMRFDPEWLHTEFNLQHGGWQPGTKTQLTRGAAREVEHLIAHLNQCHPRPVEARTTELT